MVSTLAPTTHRHPRPDETALVTRMPKALHRRTKLAAVRAGQTLMAYVTEALREHLEREAP